LTKNQGYDTVLALKGNGLMKEISGITITEVRVFQDGDEITILHKDTNGESNSLLTFTTQNAPESNDVSEAVNKALAGLDWDDTFDNVYTKQEYRKAVMNIPFILMGHP
jgi:hypothetical protein